MSAHQPRKRFGQHFLIDQHIVEQIIQLINPQPGQHLIEIGPGRGVLTRELLKYDIELTAIEIDRDLIGSLNSEFGQQRGFRLLEADALSVDFKSLARPSGSHVVGNLPYNISTPILLHLFQRLDNISQMTFMLQKEFIARMCSEAGNRDFGRLSILTQTHCLAEEILEVPAAAFLPPPRVESAVVRLSPLANQLDEKLKHTLATVTQRAFSQRRKMLKRSLRDLCPEQTLLQLGINPLARPQEVEIDTYIRLAKALMAEKVNATREV